MTTIPAIPAALSYLAGVEMTPPPPSLLPAVTTSITEALAQLPPGQTGALVYLATTTGINLAVVHRVQGRVTVAAYIGKKWGRTPVAAGIVGQVTW
jgi:hypothetical protein